MTLSSSSGCATVIALLFLTVHAQSNIGSGDSICDGSGSGLGLGCQSPELLCEPPDVVPEPPENTEDDATHLASCYLQCLDKYYSFNGDLNALPRPWDIIDVAALQESGEQCESYLKFHECYRGCEYSVLSPGQLCSMGCELECTNMCDGEDFCYDSNPSRGCGLACNITLCDEGCTFDASTLGGSYPTGEEFQPMAAPTLDIVGSSLDLTGVYTMNISAATPQGGNLSLSTLVVRVTEVEFPDEDFYYFLEALDMTLDLRAFSCKNVTVSFAVASVGLPGLSEFSPSLYQGVYVGPQCSAVQLNSTKITHTSEPDQRCGFYLRHVLHISWDLPEDMSCVTGYTVIVLPGRADCGIAGVGASYLVRPNTTEITVYGTDGATLEDTCFYTVQVRVEPYNSSGAPPAKTDFIYLINYIPNTGLPDPLSEELLTLTCSPVYDVGNERYDVNVSWTINLPTVFTAALHNSRLLRIYRQDKFPPIPWPAPPTYPASVPDCDSIPENGLTFSYLDPVEPILTVNTKYEYLVMLVFTEISVPVESKLCVLTDKDLGAPLPPQVQGVNVTDKTLTEKYNNNERQVLVGASFMWDLPVILYGTLVEYDVYLSDGKALTGNEDFNTDVNTIDVGLEPESSNTVSRTFINNEPSFTIKLQMRAVAESPDGDKLLGDWSEPVAIVVDVYEPPTPSVISESSIVVEVAEQRLDTGKDGSIVVVVGVNSTWEEPQLGFGEVSGYDLWIGLQQGPNFSPPEEEVVTIEVEGPSGYIERSFNVYTPTKKRSIPVDSFEDVGEGLSFTLAFQVRGLNDADIPGAWSLPITTEVVVPPPLPPSPVENITVNETTAINTGLLLNYSSLTVSIQWTPPTEPNGNLTRYEAVLVPVARGPQEDVDSSNIQVFAPEVTEGTLTATFPRPFAKELTVFFHIRAVNQFVVGNWSNATEITIALPPLPRPSNMTDIDPKTSTALPTAESNVYSVTIDATWSMPEEINGILAGYDAHIGLSPLPSDPFLNDEGSLEITSFKPEDNDGLVSVTMEFNEVIDDTVSVYYQMRARNQYAPGDWNTVTEEDLIDVKISSVNTGAQEDSNDDDLPVILGSTLPILIIIIVAVVIALSIVIGYFGKRFYQTYKFRKYGLYDAENAINLELDYKPTYIMGDTGDMKAPLLDEWELAATEVIVDRPLGEGAFGEVFKGVIKGPLRNPKISPVLKQSIGIPVAIKLLKQTASGKEKADFLSEIDMMKKIAEGNNPHIVNMVGCVTIQEPLCLITEFVPHGDLLSFLRANRKKANRQRRREKRLQEHRRLLEAETRGEGGEGEEEEEGDSKPAPYLEPKGAYSQLDPKKPLEFEEEEEEEDPYPDLDDLEPTDLIQFAYQIATGMEYLASLKIVHRDLACRNILLGEDKKLKITDFGMSREVEEKYVKTTKGRLPLKWMAIECIILREFTTASDVWGYGVVLWEIGTLGGFPYPTVPNTDLLNMLKQGYRLEKPDNCAPEVYQIMLECWNEDQEDRPSFSDLREKFGTLILAGNEGLYIDLQVDEMKPYYVIKDEEEEKRPRLRAGSTSSKGSTASIEKSKEKKVERMPSKNPYVEGPGRQQQESTGPAQQHPVEEGDEVHADQPMSRSVPQQGEGLGISIAMLGADQPRHEGVERRTTNPYVDNPSRMPHPEGGERDTIHAEVHAEMSLDRQPDSRVDPEQGRETGTASNGDALLESSDVLVRSQGPMEEALPASD